MGTTVLDSGVRLRAGLHAYAHCLRGAPGGVALLVVTTDKAASQTLTLPTKAERYTLTSAGGLKPRRGKRAETFFDRTKGAPPGFALRVTENGARTYYLIYRAPGSDRKQFLWIGDAARMSLAEAREKARDADKLRGQGADPLEERKRAERAKHQRPTVSALICCSSRQERAGRPRRVSVSTRGSWRARSRRLRWARSSLTR